ncbi:carbohydrate ABC transporter permease [Dellaglioa sp. L3N]
MLEENITHKGIFEILNTGSMITKLSGIVFGLGNLAHKQIVKGLIFLISELVFIYFMITSGIKVLGGLVNLGIRAQTWKFDKKLGFSIKVNGDNSMLMLINGLCVLMLCVAMFIIWRQSIKSADKVAQLKKNGNKVPNIAEDIYSLFDSRFHITLMTIPVIEVIAFTLLPLIYMISLAFTSYDHNHLPPRNLFHWVGFNNFSAIFSGKISGTFFPVLGWTLIWAIAATATTFFFGVLLALFINSKGIVNKKFYRTVFVITMAVPAFVSLLVWQNLLHISGPLNTMLINMGWINTPIPFLTDSLLAKISVIGVNMWIGIPVTMLVATGVIVNLPEDQIEAAKIDGANSFQIFRNITFPQIMLIMAPSIIQQFIGNINNFNVIYLLTGGLPSNSNFYSAGNTDLLVTWLYKLTVNRADYNLASVIGIITFILSAVFSLIAYTKTNSYQKEGN